MTAFKMFLFVVWVALIAYTGMVIAAHGLDLLPIFFGDIWKGSWPGQFNLDFSCFLMLSALWTAWRNGFLCYRPGPRSHSASWGRWVSAALSFYIDDSGTRRRRQNLARPGTGVAGLSPCSGCQLTARRLTGGRAASYRMRPTSHHREQLTLLPARVRQRTTFTGCFRFRLILGRNAL